jgi:predicted Rossmann fold flavoprotein
MSLQLAILGGGAAGYFAAIACKATHPRCHVTLMEAASRPLAKVRISGGGRCNVTTGVQEPKALIRHYPRGGRELLGPFTRFGPRETCEWFERQGVALKTEADGRVFPVSNSSETITRCLEQAADKAGVKVLTRVPVRTIAEAPGGRFTIADQQATTFDRVLIATGSGPAGYAMARSLGHTIVPCVPSLFTFEVHDRRLVGLQGVSVNPARVRLDVAEKLPEHVGPVLITHWGLSGPAILKLSAWGARLLAGTRYVAPLSVDWLPGRSRQDLQASFEHRRATAGGKGVLSDNPTTLPARMWVRLAEQSGVEPDTTWSGLRRVVSDKLIEEIKNARLEIEGRGEFKEEFVTAGGVDLKEVDFRTMESKLRPGLHLAGEILDVDGLTGGFNLQSAWTTGYLAGVAMAQRS